MLGAVAGGIMLMSWIALTKNDVGRESHVLRLVTALNFSLLLLLYGAFEWLNYSFDLQEQNNTVKALLVFAALT